MNENSKRYILMTYRTCMPFLESSFPVRLPVVLTHVPAPLGPLLQWLIVMTHVLTPLAPLLQWLVVMTHVLAPLAPLLQWLVSRCRLVALVLAPLAPLL
jgi:hypothetical protein